MKKSLQQFIKVVLLLTVFCSLNTVFAQAPQKMSYQAVVRNAANILIANTAVGVKISVLQTSASGTTVYSERHTPTTNANGLATFEIGGGTVLFGIFASINWANGPFFIKTETDPAGGTNYTISGTSQLASVPYALFAANGGTPGPQGIQGVAGAVGAQGIQGIAGAVGTAGTNGKNTLILTTTEPAGANCATGGTRQQYGLDNNGNNTLDPTEVNVALTKYVCNGLVGATGATGAQGPAGSATNAWGLTGNVGAATNFIGTTNNTPLSVKTNNVQAIKITENGRVDITSGTSGPISTRLAVIGDTALTGNSVISTDSNGTLSISSADPLGQDNDPIMAIDGETIQTKGFDQMGSYANNLKINPSGGNIGIGNTGTINNKLQIGNPPGFSGNDFAIGNGTQAMSLFQSPTASTFFTNTNFAFLPASGIGNVGIGVTDPQSTLTVAGSTASAIKTITSSYTATDKDHTIIVNMQEDQNRLVTISLPSAFQSIGRTYVIRGIALPNTVFGSGGLKCKFEREDNAGEDEPGDDHSGYIAIRDSGGYLLTSLYKFSASQSQPLGTSDYMAGLLFPPSLLFASPQSYHAQQRTCITVQSTGVKWIVVSENFTYFRDTQ